MAKEEEKNIKDKINKGAEDKVKTYSDVRMYSNTDRSLRRGWKQITVKERPNNLSHFSVQGLTQQKTVNQIHCFHFSFYLNPPLLFVLSSSHLCPTYC